MGALLNLRPARSTLALARLRANPPAANVAIGWQDYGPGAVVVASSEAPTLPAANVRLRSVGKKWRTGSTSAATLTVDLGRVVDVAAVVLQGSNLTRTGTFAVRVSAWDPAALSGPLVAGSIARDTGHALALPDAVGRYLRIELADPSLQYLEAGRLWVSPLWRPLRNFAYGASWSGADPSVRTETLGGQIFVDARPVRRELRLDLSALDAADAAVARRWIREVGGSRDLLVIAEPTAPNPAAEMLLGVPIEPWRVAAPGPARWSSAVAVQERI